MYLLQLCVSSYTISIAIPKIINKIIYLSLVHAVFPVSTCLQNCDFQNENTLNFLEAQAFFIDTPFLEQLYTLNIQTCIYDHFKHHMYFGTITKWNRSAKTVVKGLHCDILGTRKYSFYVKRIESMHLKIDYLYLWNYSKSKEQKHR